jgi:hypothetical protein
MACILTSSCDYTYSRTRKKRIHPWMRVSNALFIQREPKRWELGRLFMNSHCSKPRNPLCKNKKAEPPIIFQQVFVSPAVSSLTRSGPRPVTLRPQLRLLHKRKFFVNATDSY